MNEVQAVIFALWGIVFVLAAIFVTLVSISGHLAALVYHAQQHTARANADRDL